MATITARINIVKTVTPLDATTIAAVLAWAKTNVTDKLPADCTLNVLFEIVP